MIRVTRTYVTLEVSSSTHEEVRRKLDQADYQHVFHESEPGEIAIDMHGIALVNTLCRCGAAMKGTYRLGSLANGSQNIHGKKCVQRHWWNFWKHDAYEICTWSNERLRI